MKFSLASATLFVASAIASPMSAVLAGQFNAGSSGLCPGAPKGSIFTTRGGEDYAIYCGYAYSGATVHKTNTSSFRGCIGKCIDWNHAHDRADRCAGVSYSFQASPSCGLYAPAFGFAKAVGVKSAVPFHGTGPAEGTFVQLALPQPHNWIAGLSLYPNDVIAEYNGDIHKFNASSWAEHILSKCKGFKKCTSTLSFAADSTTAPSGRFWFGTVYSGGATTLADYTRALDYYHVRHSIAYTIVE